MEHLNFCAFSHCWISSDLFKKCINAPIMTMIQCSLCSGHSLQNWQIHRYTISGILSGTFLLNRTKLVTVKNMLKFKWNGKCHDLSKVGIYLQLKNKINSKQFLKILNPWFRTEDDSTYLWKIFKDSESWQNFVYLHIFIFSNWFPTMNLLYSMYLEEAVEAQLRLGPRLRSIAVVNFGRGPWTWTYLYLCPDNRPHSNDLYVTAWT